MIYKIGHARLTQLETFRILENSSKRKYILTCRSPAVVREDRVLQGRILASIDDGSGKFRVKLSVLSRVERLDWCHWVRHRGLRGTLLARSAACLPLLGASAVVTASFS